MKIKWPSFDPSSRVYRIGKGIIALSLASVCAFAASSTVAAWSDVLEPVLKNSNASLLMKAFNLNAKIFGGAQSLANWAFLKPESGTILRVSMDPETGESRATLFDVRPFEQVQRAVITCGPDYSQGPRPTQGASLMVLAEKGLNFAYATPDTQANYEHGVEIQFVGSDAEHPVQTRSMSPDEANAFALRMSGACRQVTGYARTMYKQEGLYPNQYVEVSDDAANLFKYVYAPPKHKGDRLLAMKPLTSEDVRKIASDNITASIAARSAHNL